MTLLTKKPHQPTLLGSDDQSIEQSFTLIRPIPPPDGFEIYEGSDTKISCPSWFHQHEGSILVIKSDSCKIVYGTSGKPRTYFERPRVKSITTPKTDESILQADLIVSGKGPQKFDYLTLTSLKNDFREQYTDYPSYIAVTPVQVVDDFGNPFWYLKRCLVVSSRKYMALEFANAIAELKTDRATTDLANVLNRMSKVLSKRVGDPLFKDLAISSTTKNGKDREFFAVGISKTKLAHMIELIKESKQILHSYHFNHLADTQDMIDVWTSLPIINYGFVNEDLVKEALDNPYSFREAHVLGN